MGPEMLKKLLENDARVFGWDSAPEIEVQFPDGGVFPYDQVTDAVRRREVRRFIDTRLGRVRAYL